jgi:thiol-disulfide isomerase/thioredoxin
MLREIGDLVLSTPGGRTAMPRPSRIALLVLAVVVCLPLSAAGKGQDERIGTRPPEWEVSDWINSRPLALKDLSGKVVLVRWWTAPGCPFCAATAPALNEFHTKYADQGLVVVGFYHHKSSAPLDVDRVKQSAEKLGFKFPIAIDPDWRTLHRWWLDRGERKWTSVSFLIDRKGVIRHIHPGGQYAPGDRDYEVMKGKVEKLLEEKPPEAR